MPAQLFLRRLAARGERDGGVAFAPAGMSKGTWRKAFRTIAAAILILFGVVGVSTGATDRMKTTVPVAAGHSMKFSEWPVPNSFPRDPAISPGGDIYFALQKANMIARIDVKSGHIKQWPLPDGSTPKGVVVASDGKVFYGGNGRGTIGELDPATGTIREFYTSSPESGPYSLVLDQEGNIWFTLRGIDSVGMLDRKRGRISEYRVGSDVYATAIDYQGNVWVSRMKSDRISRLDPKSGSVLDIVTPAGSRPRRMAVDHEGNVWVTYYGTGKLVKIHARSAGIVGEYAMPGGENSGPYAINVDQLGRIWISEFQSNQLVVFVPANKQFAVHPFPGLQSGVRNAVFDSTGRYWYLGSSNGRLGMVR